MFAKTVEMYLERAKDALGERYEKIGETILKGNCTSFDDYKQRIGVLKGIEEAIKELDHVYQELNKEDDD